MDISFDFKFADNIKSFRRLVNTLHVKKDDKTGKAGWVFVKDGVEGTLTLNSLVRRFYQLAQDPSVNPHMVADICSKLEDLKESQGKPESFWDRIRNHFSQLFYHPDAKLKSIHDRFIDLQKAKRLEALNRFFGAYPGTQSEALRASVARAIERGRGPYFNDELIKSFLLEKPKEAQERRMMLRVLCNHIWFQASGGMPKQDQKEYQHILDIAEEAADKVQPAPPHHD